ncbi:type II citrate synthase [Leifsonia xyli subsp. cynodontis DSM 46306]|uniref:Uncharacterized protein n=1 Tax=Leifsonia xyli subsp. cynodontis DSM 46306 TaxID=1389489 RepID=U3P4F9_LEIXC|nr:hypothetical protein [Leifsonia xyli]AGW40314.1 type II citrate synthase [Leifsonia xyli subsp. cynodontis DSM 46306]
MSGRFAAWYARWNEKLIRIAGPAQLGAGRPEGPDVRSVASPYPMCGNPMSEHTVLRPGGQRDATRLVCPAA